jgi:DNA-binding CsgD family transcriptional regulator
VDADMFHLRRGVVVRPDIIRIVEESYDVERDERSWMTGVLTATRPLLDRGLGLVAMSYDVSDVAHPSAGIVEQHDVPQDYDERIVREAMSSLSPEAVGSLVSSTGCHLFRWESRFRDSSEDSSGLTSLPLVPSPFAPTDVVVVNAADPTGHGCFLSANVRRGSSLSAAKRETWAQIAAHLSSGLRLRRKLAAASATDNVDAIVTPGGRVEHAEEPAKSAAAREALAVAARAQEKARSRRGRQAPEDALAEWKGLVAARWTLVEQFDHGGRRYLVAHRNDPLEGKSWIDALTKREHQIVAYASLGHWNKLVAYELGISVSTVRVLLSRASAKAGVRTRAELVDRFLRDRMSAADRDERS